MAFFGLFKKKKEQPQNTPKETAPSQPIEPAPLHLTIPVQEIVPNAQVLPEEDLGVDDDDFCEDERWDSIDIDDSVDPAEAEAIFQKALALYKEAGKGWDSEEGQSLLKDAYAHMEQAAIAGHVKAMFYAGLMCRRLVGYDDDEEGGAAKAADWFHVAANRGHREAQYLLGVFYAKNPNYACKGDDAKTWLTAAARQGHPDAIAALKKL